MIAGIAFISLFSFLFVAFGIFLGHVTVEAFADGFWPAVTLLFVDAAMVSLFVFVILMLKEEIWG